MKMTWAQVAEYCEETYGIFVDWDEEFFLCPECAEPIYREDWNDETDWVECPICEFVFINEN